MRLHEIRRQLTSFKAADKRLLKHGFKRLASGHFGYVYEHPNFDYVLKLFDRDTCYPDFYRIAVRNRANPHFPKFRGRLMHIIGEVYAVRLERLTQAHQTNDFIDLLGYMTAQIRGEEPIKMEIQKSFQLKYPHLNAALDAIRILTKWGEGDCNLDMSSNNVMMRGETPVITDPIWGTRYDRYYNAYS